MAKKKADKQSKELLIKIRTRAKIMMDADRENRQKALEDLRFLHVPGEQWDLITKTERGLDRPMYEFNKTRITVKRIVNDMRANRPQGKVRAVEDGKVATADAIEGLIRNICNTADFDTVIDYAAEYQVGAGMGAWRITVDYADDDVFEQTIGLDPLRNPFCLYYDPAAQDFLQRDAADWFLTDKIGKVSYESRWPNAAIVDFDSDMEFDTDPDWEDDEKVRIGEYWFKEPYDKTIVLLSNGEVVDESEVNQGVLDANKLTVIKTRVVHCHKIMSVIVSGNSILEGPNEWAGSMFPFVMAYGEYIVIEGKLHWFGLTRFAKDAQRSYNYSRTNAIESVALAPQAKWWMTPKQVAGLENALAESHKKNFPYNLYNADPTAPGPPQRMGGADIPAALVQEMQIASDDIKAVTGIYDASLGAKGNETSGKAINARQRQGEISTFHYMDNLGKAVRRTWEILVDLIPNIYDTERTVRVLGVDGAEDYIKLNAKDPVTGEMLHDLSTGKYDVAITVGPSYATMRQEAAEAYGELAARDPMMMQAAGDLVVKALDLPYSNEISERYQALLPPPIQQLINKDKKQTPEVAAAMAQVQQMSQMVDQKAQLVTAAEQELKQLQTKVQGDAASAKLSQAQLKGYESQLKAREDAFNAMFKELQTQRQLLAMAEQNSLLKIQLAESGASNSLALAGHALDSTLQDSTNQIAMQVHEHDLNAMQTQHELETQATQNDVASMQAQHAQQLSDAQSASESGA